MPKYYLFLLTILLFSTCSTDIPEDAFDYLAPPFITGVVQSGSEIQITIQGTNNEYYFDGYNVYVSTTSMLKPSVPSYKAVNVIDCPSCTSYGPSYPLERSPYIRTITIRLDRYYLINDEIPFSEGKYYIRAGSYHSILKNVNEDGVSNEVTINFVK